MRSNRIGGRRRDAAILGSRAGRAKPFSPVFFALVSSSSSPRSSRPIFARFGAF